MRRALLCIAVLATACRAGGSAAPPTTAALGSLNANATLVRVIDGDTIDVTVDGVEERVRLIGIDTPETKKPNTPIQCFGPEASEFTHSLLPDDTKLHLERDVEAQIGRASCRERV